VQPPLSAWFKFEVFHSVCEVRLFARNTGRMQALIEELTRWADEWLSLQIFLVSRLFADEHNGRVRRSVSTDPLRGVQVKITAAAEVECLRESAETRRFRDERLR
jgi:hypothetical protein